MNKLSTKTLKKLESVGNRLISMSKNRNLAKYFVESEKAYFTNAYMAMNFTGVLHETLNLKNANINADYCLDSVKRHFNISEDIDSVVTLDVPETLKTIRQNKKTYNANNRIVYLDSKGEKAVICKGSEVGRWHFDYKNLYEALLIADELKIKEFTVSIPKNKLRPAWFTDEKSEYAFKMIICPIRVDKKIA